MTNGAVVGAAHAQDKRLLYTPWHGELLPLLWLHRSQGIALVISEHRDGEIIARIAETLGYTTVRGSSSRGGSRALIGLIRELESGRDAAVTPDGPRGPAHVFAPGAAIAAQRTGALVLPIRAKASRAWRLKSWDRFLVPKPFAVVEVVYGTPMTVEASSPREAAEQAPRLQLVLDSLMAS
ncbi:MAG TPA: DUF374 domain-containing protein [Gemmatimonadaceae bacterium]|nr:DUF374 domain-containing protein [Gemmatimonadaceae bacterium]